MKAKFIFTNYLGLKKQIEYTEKQTQTLFKTHGSKTNFIKSLEKTLKSAYPHHWIKVLLDDTEVYHRQSLDF